MTCVWDSLIACIDNTDMHCVLSIEKSHFQVRPEKFVEALKKRNIQTPNVRWQGTVLRDQELKENQDWINEYNVRSIHNGHDTSASDPFFFLICYLFNIVILHNYNGNKIRYDPPNTPRYTVSICSSSGHMSVC